MQRELTQSEKVCGVVFLAIMLVAGLIALRPINDDAPRLRAGDDARLTGNVVAATTEAGHKRVVQLLEANDSKGLADMVMARRAAALKRGTRVRILGGVSPVEVRVMEGGAEGLAVFVARKALEPDK